mgnify:FL=1|tara:strand:+ start:976 stop:2697 length:1722 start_codon:yes stop_codon:yes gene_type:complete
MITFETLKWKNFLSTGDQWIEINLNTTTSTLIVGANGAGKSTMLDALTFALFNKPFRKISKGQLVNSINEKGTKVELVFTIGRDEYRVFRGIKPTTFEVYRNNKPLDQDAATKDMQKYLEQSILKLNYKSFTQVVILGSSTFVPFMQLKAPHRREVIEDLLDINIFSQMNQLLKDRVRSASQKDKDCTHLVTLAEEKVSSQEKLIDSLKEVNSELKEEQLRKLNKKQIQILDLCKDKEESEHELSDSEGQLKEFDSHKKSLQDLRSTESDLKSELRRVTKETKFFKNNDSCPTCTQVINPDFKKDRIDVLTKDGVSLTKKTNEFKEEITTLVKTIEELESISEEVYQLRSRISSYDRDIIRLEKDTLTIEKELDKLGRDTPNIDKENHILNALTMDLENTRDKCGKVSAELDEYKVVANLLRDSGIKAKIIKKYIPVFNTLINKYLHNMDTFFNFTLDEEFNEVIKSRFRDEFTYSSFSEGEKQKIDLALLFTWREIARMKNSAATNLLILDEVFDSSLDASAVNDLISILLKLGQDTNLFVISHKGEILIDKFKRTLEFEKVNDFSKMSEDT